MPCPACTTIHCSTPSITPPAVCASWRLRQRQVQQERYGNRLIASDLQNPDFVKLAESFGVAAFKALDAKQLGACPHKAFALNALIWVPHGDVPSPWDMIMMLRVRGLI